MTSTFLLSSFSSGETMFQLEPIEYIVIPFSKSESYTISKTESHKEKSAHIKSLDFWSDLRSKRIRIDWFWSWKWVHSSSEICGLPGYDAMNVSQILVYLFFNLILGPWVCNVSVSKTVMFGSSERLIEAIFSCGIKTEWKNVTFK